MISGKLSFCIFRVADTTGRDPFDKMVTLLAHLGPPENQPAKLAQRFVCHFVCISSYW